MPRPRDASPEELQAQYDQYCHGVPAIHTPELARTYIAGFRDRLRLDPQALDDRTIATKIRGQIGLVLAHMRTARGVDSDPQINMWEEVLDQEVSAAA